MKVKTELFETEGKFRQIEAANKGRLNKLVDLINSYADDGFRYIIIDTQCMLDGLMDRSIFHIGDFRVRKFINQVSDINLENPNDPNFPESDETLAVNLNDIPVDSLNFPRSFNMINISINGYDKEMVHELESNLTAEDLSSLGDRCFLFKYMDNIIDRYVDNINPSRAKYYKEYV